ncbi:hypothetical protein D3C71_2120050 [compost metagenome]
MQLRHVAQKHLVRQHRSGDTDELTDAAIGAADAREHIAQHEIQQALHGRKQQLHGATLLNRFFIEISALPC